MKLIPILILFFFCLQSGIAQNIQGIIKQENGDPVSGAQMIEAQAQKILATTDSSGKFEMRLDAFPCRVIVAASGFENDTLIIQDTKNIVLVLKEKVYQLGEAIVRGGNPGNYISSREATKTEVITAHELTKAACCDLAGCFETQMSVQSQVTNILTNSRELRILGLSGVYNQVLIDGFPMIGGLSYTYGISSYPGTYVQKIFVAKGANSVLQGFDGFTGQINMIIKENDQAEKVFGNVYLNNFGESQYNFHQSFKKGKKSLLTGVHLVRPAMRMDRDEDGFMDMPQIKRYMVFQKYH